MGTFAAILLLGLLITLYFLPAIVAAARKHRQSAAIFMLDVLLGWTLIGWVAALVWSLTQPAATQIAIVQDRAGPTLDTKPCPYCAEPIRPQAVVCRFCHRDLPTLTPQFTNSTTITDAPLFPSPRRGSTRQTRPPIWALAIFALVGLSVAAAAIEIVLMQRRPSTPAAALTNAAATGSTTVVVTSKPHHHSHHGAQRPAEM
jgi:hypothetical protein